MCDGSVSAHAVEIEPPRCENARMRPDIFYWGLRVGLVAGIRIRLHWSLLLLALYRLNTLLGYQKEAPPDASRAFLLAWLVGTLGLWGVILLHELGHCFTARAVGGDADEVLLWPLGGLASCTHPNVWQSHFLVAAGGPLVNVAIAVLAYAAFSVIGGPGNNVYLNELKWVLVEWNWLLLFFNLLPLYPLDGGRMFHAALWGFLRWRAGGGMAPGAYGRASLITVWTTRILGGLGFVYCLLAGDFFLGMIFLFALSGGEQLRRSVLEGASDDYAFGYDFSRGYSSLEGSRRQGMDRGPGFLRRFFGGFRRRTSGDAPRAESRSAIKAREREAHERRRVDELLGKISQGGMQSLTGKERRFLEKTSKRWSGD